MIIFGAYQICKDNQPTEWCGYLPCPISVHCPAHDDLRYHSDVKTFKMANENYLFGCLDVKLLSRFQVTYTFVDSVYSLRKLSCNL